MHKDHGFNVFQEGESGVCAIVCTGPSLTIDQVEKVKRIPTFGANRAFEFDLDVIAGCNWQFWHHYWEQIKGYRCIKWATLDHDKVKHLDLNLIESRFMDGLSTDKSYIAHHHGTGPQLLNIAYHYGFKVLLLIGWDMRYPGKVDQFTYTGKRHYFGEDPLTEKHWPVHISPDGRLDGLMKEVVTIHPEEYGIKIINCTPGSAMTCFPMMDLDEAIDQYSL